MWYQKYIRHSLCQISSFQHVVCWIWNDSIFTWFLNEKKTTIVSWKVLLTLSWRLDAVLPIPSESTESTEFSSCHYGLGSNISGRRIPGDSRTSIVTHAFGSTEEHYNIMDSLELFNIFRKKGSPSLIQLRTHRTKPNHSYNQGIAITKTRYWKVGPKIKHGLIRIYIFIIPM